MKPILFGWGGLTLSSYVVMLAVGGCLWFWASLRAADGSGLERRHVAGALSAAYLTGLLGARVLFALQRPTNFGELRGVVFSPDVGGFASFGGIIAGLVAAIAYSRWFSVPLGKLADSASVGLCLFGASARLGCFLAGCCYGRPTSLPWAVVFPSGVQAAGGLGASVRVHPTQLYEAGLLMVLATTLSRRPSSFPGERFLRLTAYYSTARFLLEFFRGDGPRVPGVLSTPQVVGLVLLTLSLALLGASRFVSRTLRPLA